MKNEKIRIAYLIGTLETGGAQRLILNIIKKINKEFFKPYLIFWREGDFLKNFIKVNGIIIKKLKNKPKNTSKPLINKAIIFLKQQKELREFIKKEKINIVHSHLYFPDIHNFLLKKKIKKLKIISTRHNIHEENRKKFYYIILNNIVNSYFNAIVCCSNNVKTFFLKYENFNSLKVIYNGVDIEEINSAPEVKYDFIINNNFNIISAGRLEKIKGFDLLINSFKIVKSKFPNTKLIICGKGSEQRNLIRLTKMLNLNDDIIFLGLRNDIYSLLKKSDLFILLSSKEGLPISCLEAMGSKLPIIASKINAFSEIIQDGINGFLVNRLNLNEISNSIIKLIQNKELREKISLNNFDIVLKKFDINKNVKDYESLYFEIMNLPYKNNF